jgi:hypothetical protein
MLDLKAMAIEFQPNCPVTPIPEFIMYDIKKRIKIYKLLVVLCSSNTITQRMRKRVKSAIPTAITSTCCVTLCSNKQEGP